MKHVQTRDARGFFRVVAGTRRSQAATMALEPGQSTGDEANKHPDADQWLYVVSGAGEAIVKGQPVALAAGSLLLIEAGETHEIRNSTRRPLVTINVYSPPVY